MESRGVVVLYLSRRGYCWLCIVRKDAIIENVKGKIMESVLPSIGGGSLSGVGKVDLPSPSNPMAAPDVTEPVLPLGF